MKLLNACEKGLRKLVSSKKIILMLLGVIAISMFLVGCVKETEVVGLVEPSPEYCSDESFCMGDSDCKWGAGCCEMVPINKFHEESGDVACERVCQVGDFEIPKDKILRCISNKCEAE